MGRCGRQVSGGAQMLRGNDFSASGMSVFASIAAELVAN